MKGASAESRKNKPDAETILNRVQHKVQHDVTVRFWSFCHPELVSGSRFLVDELYEYKGLDKSGVPKPETLKRLGLEKEPSHLL